MPATPRRPPSARSRLARNRTLDLGLALFGAWMRDLAAVAEGGRELVLNSDRSTELEALAEGLDGRAARAAPASW